MSRPVVSAGWGLSGEALRMGGVGAGQHPGSPGPHGPGPAVVNVGGGVQAKPAVPVLVVVPGKEFLAVRPGGFDRGEPCGEARPVFQRLELGLGVRVVVADVRAAVGLGDAEVGEQQRHRLGGHRAAAVGVDGELAGRDALLRRGRGDQLLGQGGGLAGRGIQPTACRLKISRITYRW
jgi:hypothetical protein